MIFVSKKLKNEIDIKFFQKKKKKKRKNIRKDSSLKYIYEK